MEFLSKLTWQDIVTGLSVVFGLVTLIAYLDQRKSNKAQSRMLEFVNRHLDKDITAEEIEELKDKKTKIYIDVNDKLPVLGRITILQDQADFYTKGVVSNYIELKKINEQIFKLESDFKITDIAPEIKDYILKEVSPKYRFEEWKSKMRDRLIILFALIVAMGAMSPLWIFTFFIQIPIGVYLIIDAFKYLMISLDEKEERAQIYFNGKILLYFAGIASIIFGLYLKFSNFNAIEDKLLGFNTIEIVFLIIGIMLIILTFAFFDLGKNKFEEYINKRCYEQIV
jgi:hypothetical protein